MPTLCHANILSHILFFIFLYLVLFLFFLLIFLSLFFFFFTFFIFFFFFFFFNDTATTEIYTLSLHDALPIFRRLSDGSCPREYSPASRRRWAAQGRSP